MVPPFAKYELVGFKKKKGDLGTALPNSLACSLILHLDFYNCYILLKKNYLKFLPMATIFLPVVKKVRADMFYECVY